MRRKILDVSDEKASDEDDCLSRSMTIKTYNKIVASCDYQYNDQGLHQRSVPLTPETKDSVDEGSLMRFSVREQTSVTSPMRHPSMPKSATLINAATGCTEAEMLEDSQRDNTDLNACARVEKSVVIMNTPGQNVNAAAELVFDMMLHSGLLYSFPCDPSFPSSNLPIPCFLGRDPAVFKDLEFVSTFCRARWYPLAPACSSSSVSGPLTVSRNPSIFCTRSKLLPACPLFLPDHGSPSISFPKNAHERNHAELPMQLGLDSKENR